MASARLRTGRLAWQINGLRCSAGLALRSLWPSAALIGRGGLRRCTFAVRGDVCVPGFSAFAEIWPPAIRR